MRNRMILMRNGMILMRNGTVLMRNRTVLIRSGMILMRNRRACLATVKTGVKARFQPTPKCRARSLQRLFDEGKLEFHGQLAGMAQVCEFQRLKREALRKEWVVYMKRPFAGPEQVLRYLSCYTHRVAIGNGRLMKLDVAARSVTFGYKDYAAGSQRKVMMLGLDEFLRRFCLHILPEGFVKIRHYGLLANRGRKERIAQARALLPVGAEPMARATKPASDSPPEKDKT